MKIDWDKLHAMLPVYAYEYETGGITGSTFYWYPHKHPVGTAPPPDWTNIDRDESYENLMKALSDYLKLAPTEKAVWFNNANGEFSNTWPFDAHDPDMADAIAHAKTHPEWKLIVYRCETDADFEFFGLMKIVTSERKRK